MVDVRMSDHAAVTGYWFCPTHRVGGHRGPVPGEAVRPGVSVSRGQGPVSLGHARLGRAGRRPGPGVSGAGLLTAGPHLPAALLQGVPAAAGEAAVPAVRDLVPVRVGADGGQPRPHRHGLHQVLRLRHRAP